MGCAIHRAAVSFRLDDYSGDSLPVSVGHYQKLSQQIAGDRHHVWACIKFAWKLRVHSKIHLESIKRYCLESALGRPWLEASFSRCSLIAPGRTSALSKPTDYTSVCGSFLKLDEWLVPELP